MLDDVDGSSGKPHAPIPFFWTDQFGVRLQVAGAAGGRGSRDVVYGNPTGPSFVEVVKSDGRVVGVIGWNAPRQFRVAPVRTRTRR